VDPKPVSASRVEIAQIMMPNDANFLGKVFGGSILAMIDLCAYAASAKHAEGVCVTASFDRVDFLEPINVGDVVAMHGHVSYVGRTSLEVTIDIFAENPMRGDRRKTNTARVTMVAIDEEGRPRRVPPLLPETREERLAFLEGKLRRELRAVQKEELERCTAALAELGDDDLARLLEEKNVLERLPISRNLP
jgi:acyl-CoA hydrolase